MQYIIFSKSILFLENLKIFNVLEVFGVFLIEIMHSTSHSERNEVKSYHLTPTPPLKGRARQLVGSIYRITNPLSFGEKGVARDFHVKEFFLGDENERSRTCRTTSEFEDA